MREPTKPATRPAINTWRWRDVHPGEKQLINLGGRIIGSVLRSYEERAEDKDVWHAIAEPISTNPKKNSRLLGRFVDMGSAMRAVEGTYSEEQNYQQSAYRSLVNLLKPVAEVELGKRLLYSLASTEHGRSIVARALDLLKELGEFDGDLKKLEDI